MIHYFKIMIKPVIRKLSRDSFDISFRSAVNIGSLFYTSDFSETQNNKWLFRKLMFWLKLFYLKKLQIVDTECTFIRTNPYPYDVPLSVRFLVEMKTLISLNAYVDVYPYPYVVPLSKPFLAVLRFTEVYFVLDNVRFGFHNFGQSI
jgi:hypothetical protein